MPTANAPQRGKVSLVGAGPGDPRLLTLRGQQLLAAADLVLYDYLVDPRILQHAAPQAETVCLGGHGAARVPDGEQDPHPVADPELTGAPARATGAKSPTAPSLAPAASDPDHRLLSQAEINARMIAAAKAGRHVVRLKGGDPTLFGRLSEELDALQQARIPFEVVPGVTAATAVSACTGIPLTHRDHASCVALITGRQGRDSGGTPLDYAALAKFPGTLVFYMGITSARDWSQALIAHGKPATTPAAIVRHASRPNQRTIETTLGELAERLQSEGLRPPAVILVGASMSARSAYDWFTARPLFGRRILVTRPAHQSASLADRLADLGAQVLFQPAIEIGPPDDWEPLDRQLEQLQSLDWLVFSSANGVTAFFDRLATGQRDLRALGNVRLAAIGPATSQALGERGLKTDLQPENYQAEELAAALGPHVSGRRVLLIRASRGRETLAEELVKSGAHVSQVVAYGSRDVPSPAPEVAEALGRGEIDWVTVTSSAIARSLCRMFAGQLAQARLAAISPLTGGVLQELGCPPTAVAQTYDAAGLVEALVRSEQAG
jgi:uroporphyrinogen III methyltransferase/synthase